MSAEVYLRWEVQDKERLHQQLMKQLAAEREHQAQLFQQMMGELGDIRASIASTKRVSSEQTANPVFNSTHISNVYSTESEDYVSSGYDMDSLSGVGIKTNGRGKTVAVLDWSDTLDSMTHQTDESVKKTSYAKQINQMLAMSVCTTHQELNAKNAFVKYLNQLLADDGLEFEYFKALIDKRFAQLKETIEIPELDRSEEHFEYYALCELLGERRKQIKTADIPTIVLKMKERLLRKNQETFVYQNLKEVLAELNMTIESEMELDGLSGQRVVLPGIDDCSVFMSTDGGGFIFETVAEVDSSREISADKKATIEADAHTICKKHLEVIKRMRERGIILHIDCEAKPNIAKMRKITKKGSRNRGRTGAEAQYIGG